jgi:mono/diheme cytochrome c family protein
MLARREKRIKFGGNIMPYPYRTCTAVLLTALIATASAVDLSKLPPAAKTQGITYAKDIHPLLEASCFRCHGNNEKPKGGLRLDSLEGALKGSKEGKVVVPGNSEKSQIVISASQIDPETAMPPKPRLGRNGPAGGKPPGPPPKPLSPEQVGLLRAWIDQGAK